MDVEVWKEYGHQPDEVARLAIEIENAIRELPEIDAQTRAEEESESFEEGNLILRLHKYRERNPGIKRRLLNNAFETMF